MVVMLSGPFGDSKIDGHSASDILFHRDPERACYASDVAEG